jgi:hypothetical protein
LTAGLVTKPNMTGLQKKFLLPHLLIKSYRKKLKKQHAHTFLGLPPGGNLTATKRTAKYQSFQTMNAKIFATLKNDR